MIRSRLTLGLATAGTALALATTAIAASGPTITSLKTKQSGNKVTVTIKTSSFKIDTADVGKKPKAGKGHEHFAMDKGKFDHPKYSGANGTLAKQLGVDGKYSPAAAPTITYTGVPPGRHRLQVHLANNNHTDTGVVAETDFTVK
jgi:hypothetical protein